MRKIIKRNAHKTGIKIALGEIQSYFCICNLNINWFYEKKNKSYIKSVKVLDEGKKVPNLGNPTTVFQHFLWWFI